MAFSHKTAIINGTEALEAWGVKAHEVLSKEDMDAFRAALNTLNPEIHECEVETCLVETWKGASDTCPACGTPGTAQGRMVYNYTPKNPRTRPSAGDEPEQDETQTV